MAAFIVLEGGEGSGKTLQSEALCRRLMQIGHRAMLVREPGSTELGKYLRAYLKRAESLSYKAELLLFAAARIELTQKVIAPALERGIDVIADRYADSSMAYQGYGRQVDLDSVKSINAFATDHLVPDLVVLLDISPEKALQRLAPTQVRFPFDELGGNSHNSSLYVHNEPRGRVDDEERRKFEELPIDFHKRVRKGYLSLARQEPERWLIVDATLPPDQVEGIIWDRVSALLQDRA